MENLKRKHLKFLRNTVFQVHNKWPQYNCLFDDLSAIAENTNKSTRILILERAYIFNGYSLFAPLFHNGDITVLDCITLSASERGAYQHDLINHADFFKHKADLASPIYDTGLPSDYFDIVVCPNVTHHVRDQDRMFEEMSRIIKPNGVGYIFEALVRELHQMPDDYVRYTPWGFEYMLEKAGLKLSKVSLTGGPFEAIAYCWDQALQYFPEQLREEKSKWFYEEHFKLLMEWNELYNTNRVRKHTSFPTAYGIYFTK